MDSSRYSQLTLVDRVDFGDDLAVFVCKSPSSIEFTPGQYATIGLEQSDATRPLLRPYSVASAPGTDTLEFFIELVDEGKLTPQLWSLHEGDTLWMRDKIVGRFVLDDTRTHHVMAATVTGVGPYVSIARHQQQALTEGRLDAPHQMLVLHGASRVHELGTYRDELRTLAGEVDWFDYVPTISRPWADPGWDGEVGRVEDVLRKHMDAAGFPKDDTAAYTCGHPQMIDKAQGIFERAGLSDDAVHEEKYFIER